MLQAAEAVIRTLQDELAHGSPASCTSREVTRSVHNLPPTSQPAHTPTEPSMDGVPASRDAASPAPGTLTSAVVAHTVHNPALSPLLCHCVSLPYDRYSPFTDAQVRWLVALYLIHITCCLRPQAAQADSRVAVMRDHTNGGPMKAIPLSCSTIAFPRRYRLRGQDPPSGCACTVRSC